MAEHDYVIANQNGANTRSDLNNALAAIVSNNSKATAPTTTYAFMWWADTANDILKQRNAADSAWINILTLSTGAPLGTLGLDSSGGVARATSGLLFNADTAAANALDDYEEGTWTPAFLSTDASWTYTAQKGNYMKIGNTVHFRAYVTTSAATGTLSNGLQISGLPFAVVNTTNSLGNVTIGYAYNFDTSQTTGGTGVALYPIGRTEENSSAISLMAIRNDAPAYGFTAEATNRSLCRVLVDGFYFTS